MRAAARAALALVAAIQAEVGIWGELAPRSFFDNFPGLGHHWVAPLGPYNEHLVRDYASAELGLTVLLACAAIWFERRVVLIAGAVFIVGTLSHFIYHLTTTDALSTTDNALSLGSFAVELSLVGGRWAVAARRGQRRVESVAEPLVARDATR